MRCSYALGMAAFLLALSAAAAAQFVKGEPAPCIKAVDIQGEEVDTCALIDEAKPFLAIYYFFDTASGEQLALKLRLLDMKYGRDKMVITALGFKEDEEALKTFAEQLDLSYHIIDSADLADAGWLKNVDATPLVLFVSPDSQRSVEQVIRGGGASSADFLKRVAENLYQKRKAEAAEVADAALEEGEDTQAVRELKGYILVSEGKLDEAVAEFGEIQSSAGLARVALEQGEYDKAAEVASQAPEDGYAQTVRAQALMNTGQVEDAAAAARQAAELPSDDWQRSEALNVQGRIAQEQGNAAEALSQYEQAIALDPYNVVALSNESTVHSAEGDTEKARETLERAAGIRDDELVSLMLSQLEEANDVERGNLIQQQIKDLAEYAKSLEGKPVDDWTTRPLVVSFLGPRQGRAVFFARAGTDTAVRHEIAAQLRTRLNVAVVERENLDLILQEQQLSALADPDTATAPGKIKIARYLSFIDFDQIDDDPFVFLRVTDTTTGEILLHYKADMPPGRVLGPIGAIIDELTNFYTGQEIRGLVADATDESAILTNLTALHGVKAGQVFTVLQEGEPIEAGGRVIAYRQRPVARIEVTGFDEQTGLALCKLVEKREGVRVDKDMKIKSSK